MHAIEVENDRRFLLNTYYDQLNYIGKSKAIEQLEMLTKIPAYTKEL